MSTPVPFPWVLADIFNSFSGIFISTDTATDVCGLK